MRYKYSLQAVLEELHLDQRDVEAFITQGVLLPDEWFHWNEAQRFKVIADNFSMVVWDLSELQRFRELRSMFHKTYMPALEKLSITLIDLKHYFTSDFSDLRQSQAAILNRLAELKIFIDRKDRYIDLKKFCATTGYKLQSCYNSIIIIDSVIPSARLDIPFYRDLIWIKKGKKWQARLIDFEELRRGFRYELRLEERKRKSKN